MKSIFTFVVLGLVGLASLLVIYNFFEFEINESQYSVENVMFDLGDHYDENRVEYFKFFNFASKQKSHINWKNLTQSLQSLNSGPNAHSFIEDRKVKFFRSEDFGYAMSFELSIDFAGEILNPTNPPFESLKEFLAPEFSFDSLYHFAEHANIHSFTIFKDGTVIVDTLIGPELFDLQRYEFIFPGPEVIIYGDYYHDGTVYIGKKN